MKTLEFVSGADLLNVEDSDTVVFYRGTSIGILHGQGDDLHSPNDELLYAFGITRKSFPPTDLGEIKTFLTNLIKIPSKEIHLFRYQEEKFATYYPPFN